MDVPLSSAGQAGEMPSTSLKRSGTDDGIVTRRLLVGAVVAGATVAFALVPTESLDGSAQKPLFFYLVPVLRSLVRCSASPPGQPLRSQVVATCDVVSGMPTCSHMPRSCYHWPSTSSHLSVQQC